MKFTVKFRTMNMNLIAGQVDAAGIMDAKAKASDLLSRRHLKSIESASIVDESGSDAALLNQSAWNRSRIVEWITVR